MELTKEYFEKYLEQKFSELPTKQDFSELPTKQDYNALKSVVDDTNEKVTRIDTRTDEDTRAALKDIESLKKRVGKVTKRIEQLELKQAA